MRRASLAIHFAAATAPTAPKTHRTIGGITPPRWPRIILAPGLWQAGVCLEAIARPDGTSLKRGHQLFRETWPHPQVLESTADTRRRPIEPAARAGDQR